MIAKILIIEDDPYVVRLYEKLFKINKYSVAICNNGQDGLAKATEFLPDLIILDIMMPNMNGLEVLEKLKQNPETASIPVIMLSNLDDNSTIKTAMDLGAQAFMVKSDFAPDQILHEVNKYL